ncbi:thioredoxin domain-containing protein [Natrarchaeobaculum sulfurireducens]|uniref:Protein-disulfide isomerase n=1 Tax=Natrarchaeobaculum sulfurireducens TaxID=2044521 RepID=A0A346PH85_9EURY|nr:thioredoxin domain-containing protein [Natrarchaeobaculum sulfurireducens]AXR78880.1 Protein-disulfide isomerase [Natrarchaeobaculum sulfurireducens]AXR81074.1 putative disulfide bond formation protein D precursor [Natrarchaeobaculum sulfurireducens]
MDRRTFLAATAGTTLAVGVAGCSGFREISIPEELEGTDADRQLPVPTLGDGDVTIEVYEDTGCQGCREFQADVFPVLEGELLDTGEATYQHRDFVVGAADESAEMANAARAVQHETHTDGDPNGDFFEYKAAVMRADDWSDDRLGRMAQSFDILPERITSALEDETFYPTLVADWERGEAAGVEGTPTVVIEDELIEDPFDIDEIRDRVSESSEVDPTTTDNAIESFRDAR